MSEVKLNAEPRTEFGKGAARRLRRAHMVPAVLYGHGTAPVHVALPGHATMLALKHSNTLLSVELNGTSTLALPKDVQRDPIKGFIEHVDLIIVRRGERVVVDVQIQLIGEVGPDALVTSEHPALAIEVEATAIRGRPSLMRPPRRPRSSRSAGWRAARRTCAPPPPARRRGRRSRPRGRPGGPRGRG